MNRLGFGQVDVVGAVGRGLELVLNGVVNRLDNRLHFTRAFRATHNKHLGILRQENEDFPDISLAREERWTGIRQSFDFAVARLYDFDLTVRRVAKDVPPGQLGVTRIVRYLELVGLSMENVALAAALKVVYSPLVIVNWLLEIALD